mmetsp:Transcript_49822/g.161455  ORF Transcript_49822/g.161455 Transcript_49822/m.161455 type:complete len:237 (+) Transcript_49822:1865-2575(+)
MAIAKAVWKRMQRKRQTCPMRREGDCPLCERNVTSVQLAPKMLDGGSTSASETIDRSGTYPWATEKMPATASSPRRVPPHTIDCCKTDAPEQIEMRLHSNRIPSLLCTTLSLAPASSSTSSPMSTSSATGATSGSVVLSTTLTPTRAPNSRWSQTSSSVCTRSDAGSGSSRCAASETSLVRSQVKLQQWYERPCTSRTPTAFLTMRAQPIMQEMVKRFAPRKTQDVLMTIRAGDRE